MLGGRKTGGLDENYAYIYQSTSVTGSSTSNKVLAITGADGDRVLSMVHLPTSDFLVAGLGSSGFTLIKIPAAFDTAGLSGTYGSVTLADKTGDFIQQSAAVLDNRGSGQLTVAVRSQGAPTTSVSTADATGITQTITGIQGFTMYIKLNNGVPENYTIGQLRKDNPNVSFPRKISNELLSEYDVYPASVGDAPSIDIRTQKRIKNTQVSNVDGAWVYEWTITEKTSEQIAKYDADTATEVRASRDEKLTESDWTQVADAPVDQAAWATYRQALRDIPAQAGFPNTIDWPVKPI